MADDTLQDREYKLYTERVPHDTSSINDLIAEALSINDIEEHRYWEPVTVLWRRGTPEVLGTARRLCQSEKSDERRLGADILSQLGARPDVFHEERLVALLQLLEGEEDKDVLAAACFGLGHLYDSRTHEALVRLKNHPHEDVRHAVAFGLTGDLDQVAIATLIELSRDEVSPIRDWATYRLGLVRELDAPEISEALADRLHDPDEDARCEAIAGLARRKDKRVLEALANELQYAQDYNLYILYILLEAATELADPRLCAALLNLRDEGVVSKELEEALATCNCIAA